MLAACRSRVVGATSSAAAAAISRQQHGIVGCMIREIGGGFVSSSQQESSMMHHNITNHRNYSTTIVCNKIWKINSDLSDEEITKIIEEEEKKAEMEKLDEYVHENPNDWKPGERKRKLKVGINQDDFEYEMFPERFDYKKRWTLRDKRCGALGIKMGMMPLWDEWGERHACTVLFLDKNIVLGHKTQDKHGYDSIQVAAGERKVKNIGKCVMGQYKSIIQSYNHENDTKSPIHYEDDDGIKTKLPSGPYIVREFRITDPDHFIPINTQINARHFVPGQNVDISGISKGKGFQGAMKRHNFGGMPASHGVSKSHRSLGSTGQCQDPGKVFKGKKMAGRMGTDRVTVQNLRILKIDRGRNLLYIKGAIPGNKGCFVEIKDAIKRPLWGTNMVVDNIDRPPLPTYEYDTNIDGCGQSGYEEIMPLQNEDPLDPDYNDSTTQLIFKE